ncbi:MAG: cytochrome P450 [Flavobacteriales bacterium]|nr:cytochrome P450 [Flavobacteriales bacterium]
MSSTVKQTLKRPPGPRTLPWFGSARKISADTIGFLTNMAREYEGISYFTAIGMRVDYLTAPEHIKHVLQDNNKNYIKGSNYRFLRMFLGQGLLTNEGESWLVQRRLAQPAFHRKPIASFAETMTAYTLEMTKVWEDKELLNKEINIHEEMMAVTLRIVGQTLMSKDLNVSAAEIGVSLGILIENIYTRVHHIIHLPLWVPTPANLRFKKNKKIMDDIILAVIDERLANPSDHMDLLAMLVNAKDEDTGETMDRTQLRDEVMTIFAAGHETSANALTWTLYLLAKHPAIADKLYDELCMVLGGRTPEMEDIPKLKYTLQIIEEAMRLFPPAWIIERHALADDQVGGYRIAKGDEVMMSPYVMHRDPKYWESPDEFNPDRFSSENSKARDKYAYYPFGGGPRFCIGSNFALLEMQLVLAILCQKYSFAVDPSLQVELDPLITLRPKGGMPLTVKLRA